MTKIAIQELKRSLQAPERTPQSSEKLCQLHAVKCEDRLVVLMIESELDKTSEIGIRI